MQQPLTPIPHFFSTTTPPTPIYTLSLHDALPISDGQFDEYRARLDLFAVFRCLIVIAVFGLSLLQLDLAHHQLRAPQHDRVVAEGDDGGFTGHDHAPLRRGGSGGGAVGGGGLMGGYREIEPASGTLRAGDGCERRDGDDEQTLVHSPSGCKRCAGTAPATPRPR